MKTNYLQPILWTVLACLCLHLQVFAQSAITNLPRGSQYAKSVQRIGITDIAVKYHRPAVNERKIWGNLVPFSGVWRAGANENTIIYFSHDVKVAGKDLAAGKYGLHMEVTEDKCSVIFSKNYSSWGSFSYKQSEDALRIESQLEDAKGHYERLTFEFTDVDRTSATCVLAWEKKQIPFTIEVDVDNIVIAELKEKFRSRTGWTWIGWDEAANYCFQNNTHLSDGFVFAGNSIGRNANFRNIRTKARLLARQEDAPQDKFQAAVLQHLDTELEKFKIQLNWNDWQRAANFAFAQKDNARAKKWVDKASSMNPENFTNLILKSQIVAADGDVKGGKKLKDKALAMGTDPQLNAYGYQLLFGGRSKEAIEVFEYNAKKHASNPNVWDSLGEAYARTGDKINAEKYLRKSLSMNPAANVKANSINWLKQIGVEYKEEDNK